jgi:hypothetical protein
MNCKQCGAPIPQAAPGDKCFYCGKDPTVLGAAAAPTAPAGTAAPTPLSPGASAKPHGSVKALSLIAMLVVGGVVAWLMVNDAPPPDSQALAETASVNAPPVKAVAKPSPVQPQWQGDKPLRCKGDERHTLKGATIKGQGQVIRAAGKCQVTLEQCVIKAGSIRVEEGARLTIKGGQLDHTSLRTDGEARVSLTDVIVVGGIQAREQSAVQIQGGSVTEPELPPDASARHRRPAIAVYGTAIVTLRDVAVTGEVKTHGGVVIELQPGDDVEAVVKAEQGRAARQKRYERNGCRGFVACYSDNGSSGKVDAHMVMPIGPEGKAVGASVRRALGANPKTRACLQKQASERVIEAFEGPPGTLECRFSGMVQGGTQMLSFSVDFVPSDAPKSPAP